MIEAAGAIEEGPDRGFLGQIERMAFRTFRQARERLLHARLAARGNDDRSALFRGGLSRRQADAGAASKNDDLLSGEFHLPSPAPVTTAEKMARKHAPCQSIIVDFVVTEESRRR